MTSWTPDRDPILQMQYEAFTLLLRSETKRIPIAPRLPNSTPVRTIAAGLLKSAANAARRHRAQPALSEAMPGASGPTLDAAARELQLLMIYAQRVAAADVLSPLDAPEFAAAERRLLSSRTFRLSSPGLPQPDLVEARCEAFSLAVGEAMARGSDVPWCYPALLIAVDLGYASKPTALVGHATTSARSSQLSALTVIRTTGRWAADW